MSKKKTNIYPYIHWKLGDYLRYGNYYPSKDIGKQKIPTFSISNTKLGRKYNKSSPSLQKEAKQLQSLLNYFYSDSTKRTDEAFNEVNKAFDGKLQKEVMDEVIRNMKERIDIQVNNYFGPDAEFNTALGKSEFKTQEAKDKAKELISENNQAIRELSRYCKQGYTVLTKCSSSLENLFQQSISKGTVDVKEIRDLDNKINTYHNALGQIIKEAREKFNMPSEKIFQKYNVSIGKNEIQTRSKLNWQGIVTKGGEDYVKKFAELKIQHEELIKILEQYVYTAPANVLDWKIAEGVVAVMADIVGSPPKTAEKLSEAIADTTLPKYAREGGAKVIGEQTMKVTKYGGLAQSLQGTKSKKLKKALSYKDDGGNKFELDVSALSKLNEKNFELREKVDVAYEYSTGSGVNVKHYNLDSKNPNATGVTFVSQTPLMYILQNNSSEQKLLFHAINTLAYHDDQNTVKCNQANKTKLLKGIRLSLIYKAISGDTYSGDKERKLADIFVIKDKSQEGGVLAIPTIEFINKISENDEIVNKAILINGKIMDDNYSIPQEYIGSKDGPDMENAMKRMVQTLLKAHEEKVTVKISSDFIRNMI